MVTFIILLALFIIVDLAALRWGVDIVDLAALRWGVDSTDTLASCEWERRRQTQEATEDQLLVC